MIESLSLNKSLGIDRINNELIKKLHKYCPSVFLALCNSCLKQNRKRAKIVNLPKSVELSKTHIDNIHCISFLPYLGKCLEKLCITRPNNFLRKYHILSDDSIVLLLKGLLRML